MDSIVNAINSLVPISDFNKGEAGKIFGSIKETNQPKLVLRRNEPECVLLSPELYKSIIDELEDLRDFRMAVERMKKFDGKTYTLDEVLKESGISKSELENIGDVEFE